MFQFPDGEDAERVADWIELELCTGNVLISKSKVASIVEQDSGSEPSEAFLSDVWRHLRQRKDRYSNSFYDIRGTLAEASTNVDSGSRLALEVCLLFSLYGASSQHRSDPKLFERMAAEAICEYVGGESFVFGWPVLPGVETDIAKRVRQVATATRERFVESPAKRYKDRGVDIITWKPFLEPDVSTRRSCQFVLLSQCAAGGDWRDKTTELPHAAWKQYIHWAADPGKSFAVPGIIVDDLWHDIAREVDGLIFDRIRIMNLLPTGAKDPALSADLEAWVLEQHDEWEV